MIGPPGTGKTMLAQRLVRGDSRWSSRASSRTVCRTVSGCCFSRADGVIDGHRTAREVYRRAAWVRSQVEIPHIWGNHSLAVDLNEGLDCLSDVLGKISPDSREFSEVGGRIAGML